MLILKSCLFVCLAFVFVSTNEDDHGFDLSDALKDDPTEPWDDGDGFDLNDALKDDPTKPPKDDHGFDLSDALKDDPTEPWDDGDGFDLNDALKDDPTKPPSSDDGFDLSEALNGDPIKPAGGDFDDSDLQDVINGDYKPEKTNCKGSPDKTNSKGKPDKTNSKDQVSDPPTAIDLVSDLVMALIGGTSEQIKRLCFSLLEMLTDQYTNAQDQ
uniref:CD99 antigen-like protein 2 isoform X1 n=1 Tax=Pristiophorus japonicus TaxID=55135 RepID=UPI00398F752A